MNESALTPTTPFGARFLDAIRGEGLPLSGFDYETIQGMKDADRDGVIHILRAKNPFMSYAMIQRLRTEGPEKLAQRIAADSRLAMRQTTAMTTLMIIMMMI